MWCSFTLEASFAGPDTGALAGSHYDTSHLESLGAHLALALLDYSDPDKSAQTAAAMGQAAQQRAQGVPSRQCDGDPSGSLSDGTTAVSDGAVFNMWIDNTTSTIKSSYACIKCCTLW